MGHAILFPKQFPISSWRGQVNLRVFFKQEGNETSKNKAKLESKQDSIKRLHLFQSGTKLDKRYEAFGRPATGFRPKGQVFWNSSHVFLIYFSRLCKFKSATTTRQTSHQQIAVFFVEYLPTLFKQKAQRNCVLWTVLLFTVTCAQPNTNRASAEKMWLPKIAVSRLEAIPLSTAAVLQGRPASKPSTNSFQTATHNNIKECLQFRADHFYLLVSQER